MKNKKQPRYSPAAGRQMQSGFTLIELIIVTVVLVILGAIAAPNFRDLIVNHQSQSLGEDLRNAVQVARSEAVKRGEFVSVCASKSGTACDGNWSDGVIVVVDSASSPTASSVTINNAGTDVLRFLEWGSDGASVTGPSLLRYQGLGTLADVGTLPATITAYVTGCTGKGATEITVGLSGMVESKQTACTSS
ncbi:GspH/FimT family pseudopilin [Gilvimarinus xylanilyticus]|uniref:Type II secretion system protein H n=1 Tax=Gilvimarinus xylanilyticus TaxID=2944139 RepID=A0A9X2I3X3_9GAMM|nr:GspH/FimT family pseudopilin [Gilvimarinus xylanilyticus]MCP8900323.1 GspH/FimT family pseudopilin [Gilvimarinus xylanilyticus]